MTNNDSQNNDKIAYFPSPDARRKREENRKPPREPVFNLPPVTQALSLALIAAFIVQTILPEETVFDIAMKFGFVPAHFTGGDMAVTDFVAPFSHVFLHGGWLHLAINVGTLMAFGAGLEKKMGGRKLLLMFFVTGLFGALTHLAFYPDAAVPLIGASGGISGLFGGLLMMLHTRGLMGSRLLPVVALWIGISLFFGLFGVPGSENPVAWTAHIGGFLAGLALYNPVMRSKIQH